MNYKNDIYDYYIHKGQRKSLFKNNIQIVKYDKKKFNFFYKDTMYIEANKNIHFTFFFNRI